MLRLDRRTLASLLQNNQQAIATFERMLADVGFTLPSAIEEASALANAALAVAQVNAVLLTILTEAVDQLQTAPAAVPLIEPDDTAPRAHLGTISSQNADQVDITGGTVGVDAGSATLPSFYVGGERTMGIYRSDVGMLGVTVAGSQRAFFDAVGLGVWGNISASEQIISTVAPGTPPLVVSSPTRVPNLYVDRAAFADGAAQADQLTNPTSFPPAATDAASTQTLVNALRAAAINKGM